MEYEQLEFTTTDPKPLMRDLINEWTVAGVPEGDGYHSLIEIYLSVSMDPARFVMWATHKVSQVKLSLENMVRVINVYDYPQKWLEILESLMPEYGIEVGNFFYFLKHDRGLIYELSHTSRGVFLSDGYGTKQWPAYKFLKESGQEIYYAADPQWGVVEEFNSPEEAVAFAMVGGLSRALLEIAAFVRGCQ